MFDTVSFDINEKKDIITIKGLFGNSFRSRLERSLLKKNRLKQLFITYGAMEISFFGFFALEVRNLLLDYLELPMSKNAVAINNAINCITENTWLKETSKELEDDFDYSILDEKLYFKILEHQQIWFSEYNRSKRNHHFSGRLLAAEPGLGKALNFNTPIRTDVGWKAIGLLKVNDKVMSVDGSYCNVTGIFPQGKRKMYRVTFVDGRTLDADAEHLWNVYDTNSKRNVPVRTITTLDIIKRIEDKGAKRLHIDLPQADNGTVIQSKLLVHPYILGYLLGNGCLRGSVRVSTADKFILEKMRDILSPEYKITKQSKYDYTIISSKFRGVNGLKASLRLYGIFNKLSYQKFIPPEYLDACIEDKKALLQGLMDSDGTAGKDGSIQYSTSSNRLAKDIQLLIRSLGGIAKIAVKKPFYTYKGEKKQGRDNYIIGIRHPRPKDLFSIPRKQDRVKEVNQYSKNLKLRFESIVELEREQEAVCISVDHPSKLFIAKDYIVTHNTSSSIMLAELVYANKILVICPKPALTSVWLDTINNVIYKDKYKQTVYSSLDKKEYNDERYIVFHYEALTKLGKLLPYIKGKDTVIIIDESHNMNEESSNRTKNLLQVCKEIDSDNTLLLSGSPIKAKPTEMVPIIELLDKRFNKVIKQRFIKLYKSMPSILKKSITERYIGYRTYITKTEVKLKPVVTESISIKLKNGKEYTLDRIREKMKVYTIARNKELNDNFKTYEETYERLYKKAKDILLYNELKEKDFKVYEESIVKIKKAYGNNNLMAIPDIIKYANSFEKETIRPKLDSEEKVLFNEAKTIVKYLALKIQGEVLGKVVGRERINCHVDLAKEIDYKKLINSTVKKTLIFSNYIDVCATAYDEINEIGYHPLKVYGEDTKYLTDTVGKFMDLKNESNPLIATYKSLSTAVPLTSANVVIFIDLPFRLHVLSQATSRLNRIGQDKTVYAYQIHLDTGDKPNINSRNIDIIEWSKNMVEEITSTKSDLVILKNVGTDDIALEEFFIEFESESIIEEKEKCISSKW